LSKDRRKKRKKDREFIGSSKSKALHKNINMHSFGV
jgi:hypothetical protein